MSSAEENWVNGHLLLNTNLSGIKGTNHYHQLFSRCYKNNFNSLKLLDDADALSKMKNCIENGKEEYVRIFAEFNEKKFGRLQPLDLKYRSKKA